MMPMVPVWVDTISAGSGFEGVTPTDEGTICSCCWWSPPSGEGRSGMVATAGAPIAATSRVSVIG